MKLKSRAATLALCTVLSGIFCAAALSMPEAAEEKENVQTESAAEYYLRDCDGFIAVYRGKSSHPVDVTDIETATLNDTDMKMLMDGIPAQSRNELLLLLEDLGS